MQCIFRTLLKILFAKTFIFCILKYTKGNLDFQLKMSVAQIGISLFLNTPQTSRYKYVFENLFSCFSTKPYCVPSKNNLN